MACSDCSRLNFAAAAWRIGQLYRRVACTSSGAGDGVGVLLVVGGLNHDSAGNLSARLWPPACRLSGKAEIFCSIRALPLMTPSRPRTDPPAGSRNSDIGRLPNNICWPPFLECYSFRCCDAWALANGARYVSGIRTMTRNEITAVAMIRNAGASSSPVRSTSHAAASGVKPPITP
jgi:hypothetical protein